MFQDKLYQLKIKESKLNRISQHKSKLRAINKHIICRDFWHCDLLKQMQNLTF